MTKSQLNLPKKYCRRLGFVNKQAYEKLKWQRSCLTACIMLLCLDNCSLVLIIIMMKGANGWQQELLDPKINHRYSLNQWVGQGSCFRLKERTNQISLLVSGCVGTSQGKTTWQVRAKLYGLRVRGARRLSAGYVLTMKSQEELQV